MDNTSQLTFRPAHLARVLDLSRATVYELLQSGDLRAIKVGRATLITAEEVRRWLAERTQEAGHA